MSTLKVTHLQNESNAAPSISISSAVGGGVTFAGISTFHSSVNIGGNLGIGIDNPESTSQLHIKNTSGNAKITLETNETYDSYINFSGATAEASIGYEPTSNSVIISNSADGLTSNERLRITSGGNVNIGGNYEETSHPLNISDSTKPSLCLHTGTTQRADFSATSGITSIRSFSNSPFTINIGGSGETEAFRISGNGDVGIGTDNPTKALHIAQNSDCAIRIDANNSNANARTWEIVVGGNASNNAEMVLRTRQDNGTGGSECARFTRSGSIKLPSGGGINFHNYGTGTNIDSNLLDDYEEGTFTPEIFGLGSLASDYGHYVKVGNLVTCIFYINIGTKTYIGSGSGTTSLQILLPFNNNNPTNSYAGASIGNIRYIDFSSNSVKQFAMNIGGTDNRLTGRWFKHNSNFVDVLLGDLYNNFSIHASVTYQAT